MTRKGWIEAAAFGRVKIIVGGIAHDGQVHALAVILNGQYTRIKCLAIDHVRFDQDLKLIPPAAVTTEVQLFLQGTI